MASWASQVSGSANCSQTTDAKRPIWHASGGINNRPYLAFSGTKAFAWALDHGGARTVFCVFRVTTALGANTVYTLYSPKRSSDSTFSEYALITFAGYKSTSFRFDYQGASSSVGYDATLGTTNGHYAITTYDGGTNTSASSYGETLDGSTQTVLTSSSFGRTSTDLGSVGGRLSSAQTVSNGAIVELYDLDDWDVVLTAAEKNHLKAYANNRYKL